MIVTAFPQSTSGPSFVLPPSARIYGLRGVVQTWNNCGPATITMGLSYFGWTEDQEYAASYLKPDEEDKNVTPSEMVRFVNEATGIRAVTRMGGTLDLIRLFIAGGFPVILSIGYALKAKIGLVIIVPLLALTTRSGFLRLRQLSRHRRRC